MNRLLIIFQVIVLILAEIGWPASFFSTYFPVLAPLPVEQNAPALALYVFLRSFAQIWGVAIGATVLQNQLSTRLPEAFLAALPSGANVAYSAIPAIPALASPLREEVQAAFASSLDVLWRVQCGLSAAGALASFFMKGLPLHTDTDKKWDVTATDNENATDKY